MNYIIFTKKKWDKNNFAQLDKNIFVMNKINLAKIKKIDPKILFFIHWSKFIKQSLFKKYLCIQFHSSNLPKGRGGSPIQNQILLGLKQTKITAFKVSSVLDAGPICLQTNLLLKGNARDILKSMEAKSVYMIKKLIKKKKIIFKMQKGKPTFFKRRNPSESKIYLKKFNKIEKLYDFMRMLDAPGYPKAFVIQDNFKFLFDNVKVDKNTIKANVKINRND